MVLKQVVERLSVILVPESMFVLENPASQGFEAMNLPVLPPITFVAAR
jgi:hypothetical protein